MSHLEVAECATVPTWFVSNRPYRLTYRRGTDVAFG